MARGFLKEILRLDQTVFSIKELSLLWMDADPETVKSRINYYKQQGDLYYIRRGLYAKDEKYDRLELATKIYTPSYISFETVLVSAGLIFQYNPRIFVASYQSRTINCDGQIYVFRRIKPPILTDTSGVEIKEYYSIATPERAFLDMLYLHKNYYFDNLDPLDWDTVYKILPIYKNKRMQKIVDSYQKTTQKSSRSDL